MNVSTVSQITPQDLAEYCRLVDPDTDDLSTLNSMLTVAKCYAAEYTGRTIQELDSYRDMVIVILVLVQDMWDTRSLYIDKDSANKVVESILGLHSVNLL